MTSEKTPRPDVSTAGWQRRADEVRTYEVRTFGCQMNVHDSERLSGLLEAAGYRQAVAGSAADVVVFNTCAVRENADNKLYGNLGQLVPVKNATPGMQIAVGGCLAQKDRETIVRRAPWVDVVFGTHNIGSLPVLLERARHNNEAQVEILESLETFPSTLPTKRESPFAAWVSISVGCNNTCTFCIVPSLRGTEKDRRPGDILAEIEALVADGAVEVTLLGQNVNTYGVEFGDRGAFAKLLRACGDVAGLERVRFTSPHPAAFTDDVIAAMAETPNVMPQLHMPLQSGSDRILKAMRRSYRSDRYLGILDRVRASIPDAAITTDLIVGFPGETESDFQATLDVVAASRFSSAFTFQYSIRPGTPAATLPDQVPKAVVQERYERLIALQEQISWEENRAYEGRDVEVLVSEGEGRKDAATHRLSGRARDNRLVHFALPLAAASATPATSSPDHGRPSDAGASGPDDLRPRPGDVVTVGVTYGAPHHLVADSAVTDGTYALRRTRAGDAWQRREAARSAAAAEGSTAGPSEQSATGIPAVRVPVGLGIPTLRRG
jgi:tRNA-2-methylthio-N6-dimethylallyladenosine synthase